jgi:hypothetical protein
MVSLAEFQRVVLEDMLAATLASQVERRKEEQEPLSRLARLNSGDFSQHMGSRRPC